MYWQKNGTALFSCIVPGRRVTYLRLTRPAGTRGRLALTLVRVLFLLLCISFICLLVRLTIHKLIFRK